MSIIHSQDISKTHSLLFNEDTHRYTLDGNHVPGVTTFCKGGYPISEGLISWQKGEAAKYALDIGFQLGLVGDPLSETRKKEILKEAKTKDKEKSEAAAELGTLLHDFAYYSELNNKEKVQEVLTIAERHPEWQKIKNEIDKFEAWKKENEDEMVASESIVASPIHQAAGKFDRLARRNGLLILSDFKTSNSIYIDHKIQLAAYRFMIREWLDLEVNGIEILRFGKDDGQFETELITDLKLLQELEMQAIRCRQTYAFKLKYENEYSKKRSKKSKS